VAGATGASLLAPAAILLAAAVIAVGTGGLSSLGSLGQVAAGPSLPETSTGAGRHPERSLAQEGIVGGGVRATGSVPGVGAIGAIAAGAAAGVPPATGVAPPASVPPRAERRPRRRPRVPPTAGRPTAPAPPARPPVGRRPGRLTGVVGQLEETARGLGKQLGPLAPVTENILNLLLGPPPSR
jgi:hypothetical protein